MKRDYTSKTHQASVYYGHTIQDIARIYQPNAQIIIFTTPKLYERYAEHFIAWYPDQSISFYIVPKGLYCNTIEELEQIARFMRQFDAHEQMLWIAFGSESVVSLVSFLNVHGEYNVPLYTIHHTIQSLVTALYPRKELVTTPNQVFLHTSMLPEKMAFVQLDPVYSHAERMIDLSILIKYSYLTDASMLTSLIQTYQTPEDLDAISMAPFIEQLVFHTQQAPEALQQYERSFEQAFYQVESSHLFSANMKRFLGILFHLIWDLTTQKEMAACRQLIKWVQTLGYPVVLPKTFVLADYLIEVHAQLVKQPCIRMDTIGHMTIDKATQYELTSILDYYEQEIGVRTDE